VQLRHNSFHVYNGALLVDKPAGKTSREVVNKLQQITGQRKIGHAGTLDPMAKGLLVLLFGEATKLQDIFLESFKTYEGIIRIGIKTDTDDITGRVIYRDTDIGSRISDKFFELGNKLSMKFNGVYLQKPPQYSAIKVNGTRSYKLARRNQEVSLQPREVTFKEVKFNFISPEQIEYYAKVSKGTYIRAMARDIGDMLNTGACLESIKRTESEPFHVDDAISLEGIQAQGWDCVFQERWISMEKLVVGLPSLHFTLKECELLSQGIQAPLRQHIVMENYSRAAIFDCKGCFQGIAIRNDANSGEVHWKIKFMLVPSKH
jgi:tRNA pseudouridine55 synthase